MHKDKLTSQLPKVIFAPYDLNYIRAASLGIIGISKLSNGENDDINNSAPVYLRKSQAEREYDEKQLSLGHE